MTRLLVLICSLCIVLAGVFLFVPMAFGIGDAYGDGVQASVDLCTFTGPSSVDYSARGGIIRDTARSGCGKEPEEVTETLAIVPFMDSPEIPAGEGVLIFINGNEVGATGADGNFVIELSANQEYSVRALMVGLVGGDVSIILEPSDTGTQSLEIIMKSEAGVTENADLKVDGVVDRVLDSDFSEFALRFETPDGTIAPLTFFDYLFLRSPTNADAKINVTHMFKLAVDGQLLLTDLEAFRSALLSLPFGEVGIEAYGEDGRGFIYSGVTRFFIGRFSVSGWLETPPFNPGLDLEGLTVDARFLADSDIVRSALVEPDGTFFFNSLPAGNWELSATTTSGELIYRAFATISVVRDIGVIMTLRTTEDILNKVPPFQVITFVSSGVVAAGAWDEDYFQSLELFAQQASSASISSSPCSQNAAITNSANRPVD